MGRAIICGGSIGGCLAASALLRAGWEVTVLERSERELSGRGAGIVTHDVLSDALREVGAEITDLGVLVEERVAFDRDGARVAAIPLPQVVTSWDRIHSSLRRLLPEGAYRLGCTVTRVSRSASGVAVSLRDGTRVEGDIVVGADGLRSAVRAATLPRARLEWSGYVVWRTLASEAQLNGRMSPRDFGSFGFFLPSAMQALGYPIAGPENDLRLGRRRYNFVWYLPMTADGLRDALTDADGRHHDMGIPPPLVRPDVIERMRRRAEECLPPQFRAVLEVGDRPFLAPVYDHLAPTLSVGRVALVGDAACVARPHVGMGVTKAALDALALARHLSSGRPVEAALEAFSTERHPAAAAAHRESRRLGGYILQGSGNPDGRTNPLTAEVMRRTAVVVT